MNKIFSEKYVSSISILWIISMACLLILKRNTLGELGLNEIGDALAGAFAPLGFFWLVAGFYQQGKGLEQNSEALRLQAQELNQSTFALNLQVQEMQASVLEQKKFYDLTQAQFLEEKEKYQRIVTPLFEFKQPRMFGHPDYKSQLACEETVWQYDCEIKNHGGKAIRIHLQSTNEYFIEAKHNFDGRGSSVHQINGEMIQCFIKEPLLDVYDQDGLYRIDFELHCKNELNQELIFNYYIVVDKNHMEKGKQYPLSEIHFTHNDPYINDVLVKQLS